MLRETFDQYLNSFNGRSYDAVLEFWAPEFVVYLGDQVLFDSPESLKKMYGFLHSYVKEEIIVDQYLSDENNLFMEARVRITALKELSQEAIDEANVNSAIMPIAEGAAYEIPQFIHYHLEQGKFIKGTCIISAPVTPF